MADTRAYRMLNYRSNYMSMPVNVLGLIDIVVVVSVSLRRCHIVNLSLLLHDLELDCRLHNLHFMDRLVAVAVAMARMQNFVFRSLVPVFLFLVAVVLFRGGSGIVTIAMAIAMLVVVALLLIAVMLFRKSSSLGG